MEREQNEKEKRLLENENERNYVETRGLAKKGEREAERTAPHRAHHSTNLTAHHLPTTHNNLTTQQSQHPYDH